MSIQQSYNQAVSIYSWLNQQTPEWQAKRQAKIDEKRLEIGSKKAEIEKSIEAETAAAPAPSNEATETTSPAPSASTTQTADLSDEQMENVRKTARKLEFDYLISDSSRAAKKWRDYQETPEYWQYMRQTTIQRRKAQEAQQMAVQTRQDEIRQSNEISKLIRGDD